MRHYKNQFAECEKIAKALFLLFQKKHKKQPHTLFVHIWDDGSVKVTLSCTLFPNGKQSDEVRLPECKVKKVTYTWYDGRVTVSEIEETIKMK